MRSLLRPEGQFITVIASVHGLIHTIELTYAALLLRIGLEFVADKFLLGSIATAAAFTLGFGALPAGWLVDRLGTRRTLELTFGFAAVAALAVALVPNLALLTVALTLLGLATGLYHPAGLSAVALKARHVGSALGWHGVGGNLGIAAAPLLAVAVAEVAGWRWAYGLLAGLCLGAAVVLHTFLRGEDSTAAPAAQESNQGATEARWGLLAIVYLLSIINGFIYRGSLTFLPSYMEEQVRQGGPALAGLLTTLALLVGAGGQVFGGSLSRRYRLERLAPPLVALVAPSLFLMGISRDYLLVLASAAFVFFNFSTQPIFTAMVAEYSPARAVGRSYGVLFFASFGIGSLAGAFAGLIAEQWGTGAVFQALAALALGVLALCFVLERAARRPQAVALR